MCHLSLTATRMLLLPGAEVEHMSRNKAHEHRSAASSSTSSSSTLSLDAQSTNFSRAIQEATEAFQTSFPLLAQSDEPQQQEAAPFVQQTLFPSKMPSNLERRDAIRTLFAVLRESINHLATAIVWMESNGPLATSASRPLANQAPPTVTSGMLWLTQASLTVSALVRISGTCIAREHLSNAPSHLKILGGLEVLPACSAAPTADLACTAILESFQHGKGRLTDGQQAMAQSASALSNGSPRSASTSGAPCEEHPPSLAAFLHLQQHHHHQHQHQDATRSSIWDDLPENDDEVQEAKKRSCASRQAVVLAMLRNQAQTFSSVMRRCERSALRHHPTSRTHSGIGPSVGVNSASFQHRQSSANVSQCAAPTSTPHASSPSSRTQEHSNPCKCMHERRKPNQMMIMSVEKVD